MAYVYRHIRLDKNEPFYIGASKSNDRYARAYTKHTRSKSWNNIVLNSEYEVENLFDDLSWGKACEKEIEFISIHKRIIDGGTLVNVSTGGPGGHGLFKELNGMYGKTPSKETRAIWSKNRMGSGNSMYGKIGYASHSIPVYQIDKKTGKIIAEYPSTNNAAKVNGWHQHNIYNAALGKGGMKSAYGYFWKPKKTTDPNETRII